MVTVAGCGRKDAGTAKPTAGEAGPAAQMELANPVAGMCPVSGEPIDNKTFVEVDGKRYGLCCADCMATFKADPAKYLATASSGGGEEEHEHGQSKN